MNIIIIIIKPIPSASTKWCVENELTPQTRTIQYTNIQYYTHSLLIVYTPWLTIQIRGNQMQKTDERKRKTDMKTKNNHSHQYYFARSNFLRHYYEMYTHSQRRYESDGRKMGKKMNEKRSKRKKERTHKTCCTHKSDSRCHQSSVVETGYTSL